MALHTASYLLSRDGRYCFRVRVPVDLIARLERVELVRALGTADGRAARFLVAIVAIRIGRLWSMIRRVPPAGRPLTSQELRRIADTWLREQMAAQFHLLESGDFARAITPSGLDDAGARAFNADMFATDAQLTGDQVVAEVAAGDFHRFDAEAGRLLASAGFGLRHGSQARAELRNLVLAGFADLQRSKVEWAAGDVGARPPQLAEPVEQRAAAPAGEGVATTMIASRSVEKAIEAYVGAMRQRGAKAKHVIDAQSDLKLLVEAFGLERRIADITPPEVGALWEALNSLPPHFRIREDLAGLDLFAKAARARELNLKPMAHLTANSYLRTLRNLLKQEQMAGQILSNPFDGKRIKKPARHIGQDRTFRPGELEVIFSDALFQGSKSASKIYLPGDHLVDDWRFWSPLIALMTGARIGEIAQLRPKDLRQNVNGGAGGGAGFTVLDINDEGGRSLKNFGTARLIPLHSKLVSLGLVKLAAERLAKGAALLLPGMPPPILDDPGKAPGQWFSERFLDRLRLKTRPGLGFHSFRHTLKTTLRNAAVPDSVSNNLCGHDKRTVASGYGSRALELRAMQDGLEAVELPSAVLRIKPRAPSPEATIVVVDLEGA